MGKSPSVPVLDRKHVDRSSEQMGELPVQKRRRRHRTAGSESSEERSDLDVEDEDYNAQYDQNGELEGGSDDETFDENREQFARSASGRYVKNSTSRHQRSRSVDVLTSIDILVLIWHIFKTWLR